MISAPWDPGLGSSGLRASAADCDDERLRASSPPGLPGVGCDDCGGAEHHGASTISIQVLLVTVLLNSFLDNGPAAGGRRHR